MSKFNLHAFATEREAFDVAVAALNGLIKEV